VGNEAVGCENCGAVMAPMPDGRTYACNYCGARRLIAVDAGQIVQGMGVDLSNLSAFLHRLAQALETAVGDRTKVLRQGSEVVHIELNLAPDVFVAKREGGEMIAQHKRVVRGIALKTATHAMDAWVDMVLKALAAHANENSRATAAVQAILGRR
jgi:hypothetical protein